MCLQLVHILRHYYILLILVLELESSNLIAQELVSTIDERIRLSKNVSVVTEAITLNQ